MERNERGGEEMRRETRLPELLAPAGSEEAFCAALAAGADAIYLGGKQFSARAYAENFDDETLARCLAAAHARGVRVYVTVNTLLYEPELADAVRYAETLCRLGVDGMITTDVGLADYLREHLPQLPLHASTQLSLHSTPGAVEVSDLGFTQIVLARELSEENIRSAVEHAPAPVEVFIHGALCVSHSGQCLFSSLVGGRSGNRGECAQPCRLPAKDGSYPLSLKDLCLARHIPALIDAGVACLKIEGRMKQPAYVGRVTAIYRRLLDERRAATDAEYRELEGIFSRSGFTDGYFTGKPESAMTGIRREQDKDESRAAIYHPPCLPPVSLVAEAEIVAGRPATLCLTRPDGASVRVTGETPAPARSSPLTPEGVKTRLGKCGGTPYILPPEHIRLTLGEGLNLSPASLNALRRAALDKLSGARDEIPLLPAPEKVTAGFSGPENSALFFSAATYAALGEERDFFSVVFVPLWEYDTLENPPVGVWLPPVITDKEEPEIRHLLDKAKAHGATHALAGNPGQVKFAREAGFTVFGDFRLNILNSRAAAYWHRHGVADAVLSPELTPAGMRDIGGRAIVYGRIPLMLTERCYMKPLGGCARCGEVPLTDRTGAEFPLVRIPPHRNLLLNSVPTYVGDRRDLIPAGVRAHFIFTTETPDECRRVLAAYRRGEPIPGAYRRFPKSRR